MIVNGLRLARRVPYKPQGVTMERVMSHRASQFMQGSLGDQRASARTPLHLSGTVKQTVNETESHIAFSRDVSTSGLFFFANLPVEIDDDLTVDFITPHGGCLQLQGRVVRLEHRSPGVAQGIAIALRSRVLAS